MDSLPWWMGVWKGFDDRGGRKVGCRFAGLREVWVEEVWEQ